MKEPNKNIVILDASTGIAYVRAIPEDMQREEPEDTLAYFENKIGFHASDCQWMLTNEPISFY
jgi:NAD(P)H-flavin reductase